MELPDLLEHVLRCPGMYCPKVDYDLITAFINGVDHGNNCGLLKGFREWLIVRLNSGNNQVWTELVLHFAYPESASPRDDLAKSDHTHAINTLRTLLERYWNARREMHGLCWIFVDYKEWLSRQDWYGPDCGQYYVPWDKRSK